MNEKPRALIICFSELHRDPRVLREIEWLRDEYQITTVGLTPSGIADVDHVSYAAAPRSSIIGKLRKAAKYFDHNHESICWSLDKTKVVETLGNRSFDLIVANDIDTVPLAVRIAGPKTRVHFDAHEYAPLELTESLRWRILRQPLVTYICREYIPRVTTASTVCQGIADKFESEYGRRFEVITNATGFEDIVPSPTDPDRIRLIYHGLAHPTRLTHRMVEIMDHLDGRFELNLMLLGDEAYIDRLRRRAAGRTNIKFLPPVGTIELARFTNQFDIGIYSLPPTNYNNLHALPNKFFEFIQARLGVAIAPSPEMASIVNEYGLGVVADDFSPASLARAIAGLGADEISEFKQRSHQHARELSAEKNREKFLDIVSR